MAFWMRLYISDIKVVLEGIHALPVLFHHIGSSYKGLAAADFLDCESGCVFTVRSALNFTAMAPALSCPFSPSRNIMFVYLWREFIPLIHWLALLQRMKEFDFSLPSSFIPPAEEWSLG